MTWLRNLPIRWKVNLVVLLTVGVIQVLVSAAVYISHRETRREALLTEMTGLARMIARNNGAPLVFADTGAARDNLQAVRAQADIASIALYGKQDTLFASFARGPGVLAPPSWPPVADGHVFGAEQLTVGAPVEVDGERVGTLLLIYDLGRFNRSLLHFAGMLAFVGVSALVLALFIGNLAQRLVSKPLQELAELTARVTREDDFALRAPPLQGGETGQLFEHFNRMLDEIERRDRDLRDSMARLQAIVAALPDPVFLLEDNGRRTELLAAGHEGAGEGLPMLPPAVADELMAAARDAAATGSTRSMEFTLGEGDETRHYECRLAPLAEQAGRQASAALCVMVDATERHRIAAQLIHAEKLKAVGELAAGIVHDFNNQLTVMLCFSQMLGETARTPDEQDWAGAIERTARCSAALTRTLCDFARRNPEETRERDVHPLIQGTATLLRRTVGKHIQVTTELEAADDRLVCDSARLQNVLMNLAVNARDAMPEGGRLVLRTRTEPGASPAVEPPGALAVTNLLVIEVEDTGHGIPVADQARIFTPFFTTKERGHGTGLGLTSVHAFVEDLGGTVAVASREGAGTVFTLRLPQHTSGQREQEADRGPCPSLAGRHILVVDDEAPVGEAMRRVLESAGAHVLALQHPQAARAYCEEAAVRIDLAVIDMMMPDLGGDGLFCQIRQKLRELPILLVSGLVDEEAVSPLLAAGRAAFLTKPFTREQLVWEVHDLLCTDT